MKTPEHYKNLLICLLSGLQEFSVDVVLGETVLITLVARVKRFLDSLWKRNVKFTVGQMYEIIDAVLLGTDYTTGNRIVEVVRQGKPFKERLRSVCRLKALLSFFALGS